MKTPGLPPVTRHKAPILAILALLGLMAAPAWAQSVILNPATVQGSISLSGQTFTSAWVQASWTDTSTNPPTTYSASTSTSTGSYSLIVNVPQGSTPTYTVYAYGYLSGSNQTFSFPSQQVNPDPATPQTLNFTLDPGIIQGTVTASGGTLNYFYIFAGSNYSYFYSNTYSLVVAPGTDIYVYGFAQGQYGGASLSPSYQYVTVGAGETKTVDWTVTLPTQQPTGDINGTVMLNGPVSPSSISVSASGPSYQNVSSTPFTMTGLTQGSYYLYGGASFGSNGTYLSFPDSMFSPSRYITVSGSPSTISISGNEDFINGAVTLGGTTTLADTYYAALSVSGISETAAAGGSASANLPVNGAYSLVVTDGSWAPSGLTLYYNKTSDPANYLYEYLYFYDQMAYSDPVALSGGQTATKNLTYAMGTVTINFKALGNATFNYPQLSGSCVYYDPDTNQYRWSYYLNAYNYSVSNVSEGGVTFTGMAGTCQIQASAYVNGSNNVTFGNLTVTVVPGAIQVIDIGGPSLTVTAPAANQVFTVPSVNVTGIADDDVVDIASIVVNGVAATLTSTNNSNRPHQVSFSATVPLSAGANTINTVVTAEDTDTDAGKQASDARTVYYKATPTVIATGGTFTYTGTPHAGGGSATGGQGQSLAVTLTYSGTGATSYGPTSAAPVNAGTYQVVAHTDGDAGTFGGDSAPASLSIVKANANVSVSGYNVANDGAAHTATGSATGVLGEALAGLDLSGTTHTTSGTYSDSWTFTDVTGNYNNASGTVADTIGGSYTVCVVDAPKGPKQSGSTIPIKVQLCAAGGVNVSSPSIVLHATGIQLVSGTQNGTLQDSGNANPGMNFRVVGPPASYMFNLQTKGFASGTYNLLFTVGADPTTQAVQFSIK